MELKAKTSSSYLDFFRTPGNRYRLMVLISLGFFSQWSGNAIISNYANLLYEGVGITSSTTKLGVSLPPLVIRVLFPAIRLKLV